MINKDVLISANMLLNLNQQAMHIDGVIDQEKGPNPHVLFGALVGGPDGNDRYTDSRNSITNNKVACDYNAGFQGAIAGMFISEIDIWCINGLWGLTPPHLFEN
jgi:hypothetical protein